MNKIQRDALGSILFNQSSILTCLGALILQESLSQEDRINFVEKLTKQAAKSTNFAQMFKEQAAISYGYMIKSGSDYCTDNDREYGVVETEEEAKSITNKLNEIGHISGDVFSYCLIKPFYDWNDPKLLRWLKKENNNV